MRLILALLFSLLAVPAVAHIGHLGEVAGHSHWIGLGAIILAGAIAAWGSKGRKDDPEEEPEAVEEEGEPA